jgi:tetratricopeptide (TPR) repeat protein
VQIEPKFARGHFNLGQTLQRWAMTLEGNKHWAEAERKWLEAAESFAAAARLAPGLLLPLEEQANCLMHAGRNQEALGPLTVLLREQADDPNAHYNIAQALLLLGRNEEAAREGGEVLRLAAKPRPTTSDSAADTNQPNVVVRSAHKLLGFLAAQEGKLAETEAHFRAANPPTGTDKTSAFYVAWCLCAQGREADGRALFREALRLFPTWPDDHRKLTWQLATHPDAGRRNGRYALVRAQVANEALEGRDADALDALSAAYAELGRFEEAIAAAQKAAAAATPDRKGAIEKRLDLYRKHQPFREDPRL